MEEKLAVIEKQPGSLEPLGLREQPGADRPRARASLLPGLFVFLLGSVIAYVYAFLLYPRQGLIQPVIDLNGFGQLARHLAHGDGFSLGYGPTLRRAPLYPAFAALLLRLCGSSGPEALVYRPVLLAQCLMVGLTCLSAFALARKLFGERTGLVAGLLCALTPQVYRYVGMTEVETSLGLLLVLMALTGLNLYRRPTVSTGALFGLVVGAATLVKPLPLFYPFVFLPLVFWAWKKQGRTKGQAEAGTGRNGQGQGLRGLLASLVVFVLCVLPWVVRNGLVSHGQFWGISSNGPGEFLRGYVNVEPQFVLLRQDFGGTDPSFVQWDAQANLYEDALLRKHGMSFFSTERFGPHGEYMPMEARVDLELKKEAIESAEVKRRLRQEPLGFIKKFAIQTVTFWYIVETRKKSLVMGGIALLALTLAGFGQLQARRKGIHTFPALSVVIYFNLMYAAILAFGRYSMPVYPTLLVLSAYGLTQLWAACRPHPASNVP